MFQTFPYKEWVESGGGFSPTLVTSLLKGLPPRGGSAVVVNAQGGRVVAALRKADMKVVACYSEGKTAYPGVLVDTKSQTVWTGKPEEKVEAQAHGAESQASVRAGEGTSREHEAAAASTARAEDTQAVAAATGAVEGEQPPRAAPKSWKRVSGKSV